MPIPTVEERTLIHGDYCFEMSSGSNSSAPTKLLPVCIERKRIGDLVLHSAARHHWDQFQRMRERNVESIFLLEGDFRFAGKAIKPYYGEEWSTRRVDGGKR